MNKIKLLSPDQAQKIAAGEVIERPVNIVKELIENAVDAQATQISLYIESAGKQLIRLVDNGCGMSPDDARLCFLPHATSKITSIDQLESITSFGFRGEALASISAVSKVQLITKQAGTSSGLLIKYTECSIQEEKVVACNEGTDLAVADLFYNVPVRKKFLKQDETEWNQIQSLFHAMCLSHPSIFFKLFNENKLVLNAPPAAATKDRITQLWDFNFAQQLVPLQPATHLPDWLSVAGYISNHHFWRHGKNTIFFFINDRWIKNPELSKALLKGYFNVLPPGKFPAAFIMLTVNKDMVDINCHPKKEEVRFIKPVTVQTAITTIVKQTLEQNVSQKIAPERVTTVPVNAASEQKTDYLFNVGRSAFAQVDANWYQEQPNITSEDRAFPPPPPEDVLLSAPLTSCHPELVSGSIPNIIGRSPLPPLEPTTNWYQEQPEITKKNQPTLCPHTPFTIIGQLFKTYIIIDNEQELVLIDQHAAHERILYEKFLKNFERKEGTHLLFPEVIQLTKGHLALLVNEKDFFAHQGLELEQISSTEIIIKTAPPQLTNTSLKEFVLDAVTFMEENEHLDHEIFRKKLNEHVHSHMACKAAIKAGDILTPEQMKQVVQDLYQTEKRFMCIHGRPTMWSIDKNDIEKHFRRT